MFLSEAVSPPWRGVRLPARHRPGALTHLAERVHPSDVLLPSGLLLWAAALHAVEPAAMNDWGLLSALPVAFFAAVALLVVSIATVLAGREPTALRCCLHLAAFIVVLHGTVPILFAQPNYPWTYKHIGVASYVLLHGRLDASVDLYQNWPGLFVLAAWVSKVAALSGPATFARWAPLYFNALICLELGWAAGKLAISRRARWLALFLFAAANWVGQDYFAPQAIAFVLGLAVCGLVLGALRTRRALEPTWVETRLARVLRAPSRRPSTPRLLPEAMRPPALAVLFAIYAVVVATHQLTPFMIVFGVGSLTVAGLVRPRWVAVAMAAIAVGYVALHISSLPRGDLFQLKHPEDLFMYIQHPFGNGKDSPLAGGHPEVGHRYAPLGAPGLMLLMWGLAALGGLRRLRRTRPVLTVGLLGVSPALLWVGQSYGGEAVYRIYLFSLPWVAVLAAAAFEPHRGFPSSRARLAVATVLCVSAALFMFAFYGSEELYRVRPGDIGAARYFYDHAPDGSLLALTSPYFPRNASGYYDRYPDDTPSLLLEVKAVRHRMLGASDVPTVEQFVRRHAPNPNAGRYIAFSTGQTTYAETVGLSPRGALDGLQRALQASPHWARFYRNADAAIYQLLPGPPAVRHRSAPRTSAPRAWQGGAAFAGGVLATGIGLLAATKRRRKTMPESATIVTDGAISVEVLARESGAGHPSPIAAENDGSFTAGVQDGSGEVRARAVAALDAVRDAPLLLRLLDEDLSQHVRLRAVQLLGAAGHDDQIAALDRAAVDPDPQVRAAAFDVLPSAGTVDAARHVVRGVDDASPLVRAAAGARVATAHEWMRWMAVRACSWRDELFDIVDAQAPGRLADEAAPRMSSPDAADRLAATQVLARRRSPADVLLLLHAVRDDDVRVRRAAVAAVAGRTEALTALSAALADPDRDVRLAALAGLAQIDDERALDSMVFAASDPDSDVRDHALEALVANASFGLARRLAAGLSERNVHSIGAALVRMGEAGRRALTAVVSAGPPERAAAAASLLKGHDFAEGLSSVDPGVRGRAVDALAHLATADAVERLIGALSDPSPVVRARAVTRLSELGDQRGLEAVRRMLASEQDPRVIEGAQH